MVLALILYDYTYLVLEVLRLYIRGSGF